MGINAGRGPIGTCFEEEALAAAAAVDDGGGGCGCTTAFPWKVIVVKQLSCLVMHLH